MNLPYRAMTFAIQAHHDQKRKYTGEPYFGHLAEVAGIVASVNRDETMIATAWLHDCVEDQGVTKETLVKEFGLIVAEGVMFLSDLETGNRAERKEKSRTRLAWAPGWVQTIKCADLISNTKSIVQHDPKFAKVYLAEKEMLLNAMSRADTRLRNLALSMCMQRTEHADPHPHSWPAGSR